MLGFLLKIVFVAVLVAGIGGVVILRGGSLPGIPSFSQLPQSLNSLTQKVDVGVLAQNLNATLDNLVTHGQGNSPLVLGVKVTNDTLNAVVDAIYKLPPDQIKQIQSALCSPATQSGQKN